MKIALCLPMYDDATAEFTVSLAGALVWFMAQRVTYNGAIITPKIEIAHATGSLLPRVRESIAERAMAMSPDYLVWLDSDQVLPQDTFARLLIHDLPFVGCNQPRRAPPHLSSASNIMDDELVPIDPKRGGLEEVDLLGFGVTLTKADLLKAMPKPWFGVGRFGEDGHFCEQARRLGVRPVVDHALSAEVGHVARKVLRFGAIGAD